MTKLKNVSLEEQIEIAKDCLVMERITLERWIFIKFHISRGEKVLRRRRRRDLKRQARKTRNREDLTPEEKIQREMKRLERKNSVCMRRMP
ncbi:hypothetical protein [Bacillus haynesii]|uniref:hypothetical protein n=1 Tax=Bacillus haynesii TaxID=1925021 RepID=UPI00227E1AF1|nr:hypothetical protein [Bacillus haynesii]MCY8101187.1 hypothetical protein [Bacillus haynesii]MCY8470757.1 hypothetical protein [Bacillus haynesii]